MGYQTRQAAAGVLAALMAVLAGCGGGKITGHGQAGGGNGGASDKAKLAQLEASGEIPQLDRLPTLQGLDANMNGVRDDIERHIQKKYKEPKQQAAAMQMARALQAAVTVDVRDPVAVNEVSRLEGRAVVCLGDSFRNAQGVHADPKALTQLESMTTNTKERLLAYLAYAQALSGSVLRNPKGDTCD